MKEITFKVKSELYGQTDCVINDIGRAIKTGFAPCGDGCDYKLMTHEIEQLRLIQNGVDIEFEHNLCVWHGTNKTNQKSILKKGFKPFAWFARNEGIARRYALMASKRVSSAVTMFVKVDPQSVFDSGDYFKAKGKLKLINGVYQLA